MYHSLNLQMNHLNNRLNQHIGYKRIKNLLDNMNLTDFKAIVEQLIEIQLILLTAYHNINKGRQGSHRHQCLPTPSFYLKIIR